MSINDFESKNSLTIASLKASYKAFLNRLQPGVPFSGSLEVEFVSDFEKSRRLANCFNVELEREGIDQLIGKDVSVKNPLEAIQEHLCIVCDVDEQLHSLFNLAVNMVFCGGSSHAVGGTTSAALGVVWGNPEMGWKTCDYLEFFVHELTHTLMFLDELRFLHYKNQDAIRDKENFSLSAILQAERPIDRVLHSIVVATEVLLLRMRNLVDHSESKIHPPTDQLVESTQNSIERLMSHPNRDYMLTSRAWDIVEICRENLSQQFSPASLK